MPLEALNPHEWPIPLALTWRAGLEDEDAHMRWKKIDREIKEKLGEQTGTLVVVGHDPQASWLLHHLVEEGGRGQRGAGPLPLARGELAMLGAPQGEPLALVGALPVRPRRDRATRSQD